MAILAMAECDDDALLFTGEMPVPRCGCGMGILAMTECDDVALLFTGKMPVPRLQSFKPSSFGSSRSAEAINSSQVYSARR